MKSYFVAMPSAFDGLLVGPFGYFKLSRESE